MEKLVPASGDAETRAMGLWAESRTHAWWMTKAGRHHGLEQLASHVARRRLAWSRAEVDLLWRTALTPLGIGHMREELLVVPFGAVKKLSHEDQRHHLAPMHEMQEKLNRYPWGSTDTLKRELDILLALHSDGAPGEVFTHLVGDKDRFAVLLREEYGSRLTVPALLPLLREWITATSSRPSARWLQRITAALTPEAVTLVHEILQRLSAHRERTIRHENARHSWTERVYLSERTTVALRGMIWTCEPVDEPWVVPLLGDVAVATGTGIGGSGANARSEMLANAAVGVLARRGGLEVVAHLARVQAKVRKKSILAGVTRTLEAVAVQEGLSTEQLLERTVPTFGLGPDGTRVEHGLRLSADGTLIYTDASGKVRKAVPKTVREEHGETLAELKATAKELKKALPSERFRIERALTAGRIWLWREVCEFYLDHPVTGPYGRVLIWEILQGRAGIPVRTDDGWELTDPPGRGSSLAPTLR